MAGNKKQAPKKNKTRPAGGYLDNKNRKKNILDQAGGYNIPDKKEG